MLSLLLINTTMTKDCPNTNDALHQAESRFNIYNLNQGNMQIDMN